MITLFPDQIEIYHSYPIGFQKSAMAGRSYALADERPKMKSAREFNRQINIMVGEEDIQLVKWSAEACAQVPLMAQSCLIWRWGPAPFTISYAEPSQ